MDAFCRKKWTHSRTQTHHNSHGRIKTKRKIVWKQQVKENERDGEKRWQPSNNNLPTTSILFIAQKYTASLGWANEHAGARIHRGQSNEKRNTRTYIQKRNKWQANQFGLFIFVFYFRIWPFGLVSARGIHIFFYIYVQQYRYNCMFSLCAFFGVSPFLFLNYMQSADCRLSAPWLQLCLLVWPTTMHSA